MIQVDALSMQFGDHVLFNDASFSIGEGERCSLVGRNGTGKSTLFKILAGQEVPDSGSITMLKGYKLGVLNQHIQFTMPTILEEGCLGLPENEEGNTYKAERILFGLGFKEEDMEKSPADFSGGYQLRLHLAKVLISEPSCLLLDEPTNYLDIVSIRWLTKFLQRWPRELVLISHDREFLDSVCSHTMGIHRQKIRKIKGNTVNFYEQILQEEEIYEKTRVNIEKKRAHAQSFIDRFGAKASKAVQAQSRQKLLDRIPILERLKELEGLDFSFKEAPFNAKILLEAQHLDFSYDSSEQKLIEDFSLTVEKNDRIAIVGKNGRGKSTLLRLLTHELTPSSGCVKRSDNVVTGYFGQTNIDRLHPDHTIEEEIASANPLLNTTTVRSICGSMMFGGDKAKKRCSFLSGGEKSRVLLGKILAAPCNLLLLDEPTHHLDMESIESLIDAIEDFEGAVILVTHSELILQRLPLDKIVVCRQGKQEIFLGNYRDFLEKDGWHDDNDTAKAKKRSGERREEKQLRSELIIARSKALKPFDQKIAKLEAEISKLEISQAQVQEELLNRVQQTDQGAHIQELTKKIAATDTSLQSLYADLEDVLQKHDAINQEYTKKIETINC